MAVGFDPFRLEPSTVLMMGVVNDCLEVIKYNHDHPSEVKPAHSPWIAITGYNILLAERACEEIKRLQQQITLSDPTWQFRRQKALTISENLLAKLKPIFRPDLFAAEEQADANLSTEELFQSALSKVSRLAESCGFQMDPDTSHKQDGWNFLMSMVASGR